MGIAYPTAIDNRYAIWRGLNNHYWPALYFVDARGRIRQHHFGEGAYERSERIIQQLLSDAGVADTGRDLVSVEGSGLEAAADWDDLESPETYLGYERTARFASPSGLAEGMRRIYAAPAHLRVNEWGLAGDWTVEQQPAMLHEAGGRIVYQFHARDLHLVMGPAARVQRPLPGAARWTSTGRRARERRRCPGQWHVDRAAAASADPPAGANRRPTVRDRVPGCGRGGLRVHLRLMHRPPAM